jgi:hypothetical protein
VVWTIRIKGKDAFSLAVSDAFLHVLLPRVHDPEVMLMDPYRDATLDRRLLTRWQAELARIAGELRAGMAASLAQTRRLPDDPASRSMLLHDWVERELATDQHFQMLREVEAVVALALEGDGLIVAMGD